MSLLMPVTSAPLQPAQARDPVAFATAPHMRASPVVGATLTQSAVQQAKAGSRAELLSPHDLVSVAEKRHRLVGPPPTFDVNLLQHIRETQNDPPEPDKMAAQATDSSATGSSQTPPESLPKDEHTAALYRQLGDRQTADETRDRVDTRL